MRNIGLLVVVSMLMLGTVLGAFPVQSLAANAVTVESGDTTVKLTEAQKKELAALHKEILDKRKEVISKYVEYGVMTKEKGNMIISRLEKRYEKLEENGFVLPQKDHSRKKHFH